MKPGLTPSVRRLVKALLTAVVPVTSEAAWAQASPFMTGATALQTNILAWLTRLAHDDMRTTQVVYRGKPRRARAGRKVGT